MPNFDILLKILMVFKLQKKMLLMHWDVLRCNEFLFYLSNCYFMRKYIRFTVKNLIVLRSQYGQSHFEQSWRNPDIYDNIMKKSTKVLVPFCY